MGRPEDADVTTTGQYCSWEWSVLLNEETDMHEIDVRCSALRLVDNKAVLYFDAPTPSEALNWYRGKRVSSPFSLGEALTSVI